MCNFHNRRIPPVPMRYLIRVRGHLDETWSSWFDNLTITHDERGDTSLVGPVVDQAALYGLLNRARDLGLTLLEVTRLEPSSDS